MVRSTTRRATLAMIGASAWGVTSASARTYPDRAIRLFVGGAAGSVPDLLARPVAERLSSALGQQVIVDNRPGAAGAIAIEQMLRAGPDGYALALATMSQAVFNSYLLSKLSYDPLRDLEPIGPLVTGAMVLVAHPSFPARTLAEFIALAKATPGRLFMAMPQAGSPPHVVALLLNRAAGIDVTMVAHKSGAEAVNAVVTGQIPLAIDAPTILAAHLSAGRLRGLAVTGRQREALVPDVPTAVESGLAEVQGEAWIGLVAPSGTPADIVNRLNREVRALLAAPDIAGLMARMGFRALTASPQEFRTLIKDEHVKWGRIIQDAGLKLD